jgi:hypothetical protein
MDKCYRCDSDGVTREHAPPDCFFPTGYRDNLVTVPSCHEHNTKNSKDVEYVRNVIVSHFSTNDVAREHFQNKVKRSFNKSSKLFDRTFKDVMPISIDGEETGIFSLDLLRNKTVMEALAYALYYKEFGRTYSGTWEIFCPQLLSPKLFQNKPDGWEGIRHLFQEIGYTEIPTPQPKVFRYRAHKWDDEKLVYVFEFYGGFIVNALAIPLDITAA